MSKHLQRDLEHLKKELLSIASMVEVALNKAIPALIDRRLDLAEEVIQSDNIIDEKEVLVEEECLKILALHQPVAVDLRFIISVLKVTNDLERMGDLCVNIAERSLYLSSHPPLDIILDFPAMTEGVQDMVRKSLDSLTTLDTKLARDVLAQDDAIDAANREMFNALQELMHKDSETIERAVHMLSASRHLERIADLATNIVQDVVYMVDGELIRHRHEEYFDSLIT
ncbi:Phosphate transport system regulatory protein PhoU [hydrothermal vent metagenome]|uniref:Phosphate transport system regulatory protein PhoU n=1 Tax=hydrothermal vent metagenome TaxID=652676 RepID=A0A3B1D9Q6_9ZZZZ